MLDYYSRCKNRPYLRPEVLVSLLTKKEVLDGDDDDNSDDPFFETEHV